MIDTTDLPNWIHWTDKQQPGVNRGYLQAYINTNDCSNQILISDKTESTWKDEDYTVSFVTEAVSGFSGNEKTVEWFDTIAEAEEYARDYMVENSVEVEEPLSGTQFVSKVWRKVKEQGLTPQNDAEITGVTGATGSTGFSIRPIRCGDEDDNRKWVTAGWEEAEGVEVNVPVDGKASGLSFHERKENQEGGEVVQVHEPVNQEQLHSDIRAALERCELEVKSVRNGGYQTHWDHTVRYTARTTIPSEIAG